MLQLGAANVASVVADDKVIASIVPRFIELGLTVSLAIWVDPRLMGTGAALAAVPNLTAAAVRHNLTGTYSAKHSFRSCHRSGQQTCLARSRYLHRLRSWRHGR